MITTNTHPTHAAESFWKLVRNSAVCGKCGDHIESKNRHDFKWCKCGNVAVDGGKDYVRRAFETNNFIEDCEWHLLSKEDILKKIEYYAEQVESLSFYADYVTAGNKVIEEHYSLV